ncbi:MAG: hypothetical protein WBG86_19375, partial [Polyangiales bacterium]
MRPSTAETVTPDENARVVRICVFLMSGLACFAPGVAGAQYGATAQVKREIPSGNALDPTAAGTDIVVR